MRSIDNGQINRPSLLIYVFNRGQQSLVTGCGLVRSKSYVVLCFLPDTPGSLLGLKTERAQEKRGQNLWTKEAGALARGRLFA